MDSEEPGEAAENGKAPGTAQTQEAAHCLKAGDSTSLLEQSLERQRWEDKYSCNPGKTTARSLAMQTLWVIAPWPGKNKGRQKQHRSEYLNIHQHPARDKRSAQTAVTNFIFNLCINGLIKSLCYPTLQSL